MGTPDTLEVGKGRTDVAGTDCGRATRSVRRVAMEGVRKKSEKGCALQQIFFTSTGAIVTRKGQQLRTIYDNDEGGDDELRTAEWEEERVQGEKA